MASRKRSAGCSDPGMGNEQRSKKAKAKHSSEGNLTDASAATKVFGITELFEMVLIGVNMKTLLLSKRVNRQWRDVIIGSKQLKQKLYMQEASTARAVALGMTAPEEEATLGRPNLNWDCSGTGCETKDLTTDPNKTEVVILNPLLLGRGRRDYVRKVAVEVGQLSALPEETRYPLAARYKAAIMPGSWQMMFISAPPPLRLGVTVGIERSTPTEPTLVYKYCNVGGARTLGSVMERVNKEYANQQRGTLWALSEVDILCESRRSGTLYTATKIDE